MKSLLSAIALLMAISSYAQYQNDNKLFRTVYPQDLCAELPKGEKYLLLDVRSKGEYSDTSSFVSLNLGHLKNAVNINVRELGSRLNEISQYKDLPVYVYCSHSQRSRRASKMLADSGFTKVVNINGGVTAIRQLPENDCANRLLETAVDYNVISPAAICRKITDDKKIFLIDVRSDSAFRHISTDAKTNAMGTFAKSINIPLSSLETRLGEIPKDRDIVVTDLYGDDASKAAALLTKNSYRNVSVLLEGVDRFTAADSKSFQCAKQTFNYPASGFQILGTADFSRFINSTRDVVYLDIRTADEFNNKHKDAFRNIGHVNQSINIPVKELQQRITELNGYKQKPIVVYSFGGNTDAYTAAAELANNGFKNVYVLNGGLFNIRWTAANVKGYSALKDIVVDVPAENL